MPGKILVCMGSSGISAGAQAVIESFRSELHDRGLTDAYKVLRVGDRGLFRDVLVEVLQDDGARFTYEHIRAEHVPCIVAEHLVAGDPVEDLLAGEDYERFFKDQTRVVLSNCGEIDPEDLQAYVDEDGYSALKKVLQMPPGAVIEEVKAAGLRGRGGAGFPTGVKWQFGREAAGDVKYIVCNADEGDPGAFMDRSVLEGDPQEVLEGMIIAGYAVGAHEGYIYCRAEYPLAVKRLELAIEQANDAGYLGEDILGSDFAFQVSVVQGAGAFVCGEETALLASIEGRRGMPRTRPPFPAQQGLFDKPTIINNVETLANIRHIFLQGADRYAAVGTEKSKGTKVFALAGKVKNTGLVEVPMGTTIRELIMGPGGGMARKRLALKAVQMGGPSGGCIPEHLLDLPIDYDSINQTGAIMGSGGMIVMDQKTCMVDVARYFLQFTVEESCGKCVPCRVGLKRMLEVLEEITAGRGTMAHLHFLETMADTVRKASLCGLGNTAPNPVLTTIKYFRDEYLAHIEEHTCPARSCTALLEFAVDESVCTKCGRCYQSCPADAIIWKKKHVARIDQEKCIRCKSCIAACDFQAIR